MEKFSGPLARRYGTALFEALKDLFKSKEELIQINDYIKEISQLFDKKTIKVLKNQALSAEKKDDILSVILNSTQSVSQELSKYLKNFFSTIITNKRAGYIPYIFDFYFKKSDAYLDIVRAQILSAKPMSEETLSEFEKNITHNMQKKVVFSNFIDESLQCGFLIKIGSTHIDASLKSFLTKLNEAVR